MLFLWFLMVFACFCIPKTSPAFVGPMGPQLPGPFAVAPCSQLAIAVTSDLGLARDVGGEAWQTKLDDKLTMFFFSREKTPSFSMVESLLNSPGFSKNSISSVSPCFFKQRKNTIFQHGGTWKHCWIPQVFRKIQSAVFHHVFLSREKTPSFSMVETLLNSPGFSKNSISSVSPCFLAEKKHHLSAWWKHCWIPQVFRKIQSAVFHHVFFSYQTLVDLSS